MYFLSPRDALQISSAARKVGGYAELCRLNEEYLQMKYEGKQPQVVRIEGVWIVREKGTTQ